MQKKDKDSKEVTTFIFVCFQGPFFFIPLYRYITVIMIMFTTV